VHHEVLFCLLLFDQAWGCLITLKIVVLQDLGVVRRDFYVVEASELVSEIYVESNDAELDVLSPSLCVKDTALPPFLGESTEEY